MNDTRQQHVNLVGALHAVMHLLVPQLSCVGADDVACFLVRRMVAANRASDRRAASRGRSPAKSASGGVS